MFLNSYSVRVTNGKEVENGYVEMAHGAQYEIVMRNAHSVICDAEVSIDGKPVGTFRIPAMGSITLERKPDDRGKFTFFKEGTSEAFQAQIESGNPNNGLVQVVFTPERKTEYVTYVGRTWNDHWNKDFYGNNSGYPYYETNNTCFCAMASPSSRSAGGTGLTGYSNQNFHSVESLDYDYSGRTVITLRLIAVEKTGIRPLSGTSNPIPPYIR